MSDTDQPTGGTGGPLGVSDPLASDQLPERMRVHELARLLSVSSRDVLSALTDLGADARSAQSSIDRAVAVLVIDALLPSPGEDSDLEVPDAIDPDAIDDDSPVGLGMNPLFAAPVFLPPAAAAVAPAAESEDQDDDDVEPSEDDEQAGDGSRRRRRRGRRGRGRGRGGDDESADLDSDGESGRESGQAGQGSAQDDETESGADKATSDAESDDEDTSEDGTPSRRRRRRRRRRGSGAGSDDSGDAGSDDGDDGGDPPHTVTHVRAPRASGSDSREENGDGVQGVRGSTRLEAKRQRRRDGRDAGRRRAPILTEAEFLARRESVERSMVVRQLGEQIQIAVLEDGVLVEHFVTGRGNGSLVGNIYLGRVQNVLPSMEAAFVDIGRGRNAVLYAGEVDWDSGGLAGKARKIEQALSSGDTVLVQVTKDPIGHKGARLTTQLSLAGRFLVYVPSGGATGISRKLPDTERKRLKDMLKQLVSDDAGVIIRTASEGVSHDALERDVRRLQAQWEVVKTKAEGASGSSGGSNGNGKNGKPAGRSGKTKAPQLLYEEPDLLVKVVRDQFNEDFSKLVVAGDDAWDTIEAYVRHVAPELADRLHRHVGTSDAFTEFRIDEQLTKALDRKVWLPSGGTLVIDRTEAMTVIDVNTGKFTGSGGNLEETVTRNNLEAAEEIVRQLRLRDVGGIIVIDFIDMVLESNRELVLRRLTECLGRDRTRHQVSEVTSLGLVQMTRKRVGAGLLEAFSTPCEHCRGRGVIVSTEPVAADRATEESSVSTRSEPRNEPSAKRGRGRSRRGGDNSDDATATASSEPEPAQPVADEHVPDPAPDQTPEPEPEIAAQVEQAPVEQAPVQQAQVDTHPDEVATDEVATDEVATDEVGTEEVGTDEIPPAEYPTSWSDPVVFGHVEQSGDDQRPARRRRRAASRPAGPPSGPNTADPV